MNANSLARIAALVLFVVAAILAFLTTTDLSDIVGVIAVGLAAWVASTLA